MTISTAINENFSKKHITFEGLMSDYFSQLKNFLTHTSLSYSSVLENIEQLTEKENTQVLLVLSADSQLLGGLVSCASITDSMPINIASKLRNDSGIRLLAIDVKAKGLGIGRSLVRYCIDLARSNQNREIILHTSKTLGSAWRMYEKLGFKRSSDLDFYRDDMVVFGFRLAI